MAIDVCITADVEFSIAGSFGYPRGRLPVGEQCVACRMGGRSHGLSFMLHVLREHDLKATFFPPYSLQLGLGLGDASVGGLGWCDARDASPGPWSGAGSWAEAGTWTP